MTRADDETVASQIPAVPFAQALRYWLKLGFISFGGPAGQIALMHEELVERQRWISEQRFLHALNYCMLLPGPEAQQLATYLGWLMHRRWGGILAGSLFVLPSLLMLIALSALYARYGHTPVVDGMLYGIRPAVTALVLAAAWRIGSRALRHPALWSLSAASFVAIRLGLPFPALIAAAAALGGIGSHYRPQWFQSGAAHRAQGGAHAPALIDDHTPPPAHARFERTQLLRIAVIGLVLAGGVEFALWRLFGWQGVLSQMGWFFTKAALLSFGGAYAVLPYVFQGAVQHYGWLGASQMMDGLALGESTPGPLIMIVAFVGFMGGWQNTVLAADGPLLAGIAGACVATFFTFLPSFLFILIGAPLVEATRGQPRLSAPLTAVTAAVVGVIVNLALFFAAHTFWPQGYGKGPDLAALLLAAAALLVLLRYQLSVPRLILACAALGWCWRTFAS